MSDAASAAGAPDPQAPAMGASSLVTHLWRFARPYRGLFLLAVLASVGLNVANLVRPMLVKVLTDRVLTGSSLQGRYGFLAWLLAAMLGATLLKGGFTWLQGVTLHRAGGTTVRDLREACFDRLLRLPVAWIDQRGAGDLLVRFTDDLRKVNELLTSVLLIIINDSIVLVASLAFMVAKDVQLTVLAMIVTPAAGLVVRRYARRLTHATDAAQAQLSDLTSHVHDTVSGIKQVKAFNREGDETERFRGKSEQAFRHAMRLVQLTATQNPIMEVLATGGIALVMWYCALKIISGDLTLGDLLAFWAYMLLAVTPINRLPQTVGGVSRGHSAAKRLLEILDTPVEGAPSLVGRVDFDDVSPSDRGRVDFDDVHPSDRGRVDFDDVHFAYRNDRADVLRGLSLDIAPGERVVIVGRNGAGKSTFANLLPRFYDARIGTVAVNGIAVDRWTLGDLRLGMGILAQEPFLFRGTVRENIAYGREGATLEEVEAAARAAGAHAVIEALPDGYDHVVAERGANLSGGQRQRIALARALIHAPPLVILDEATASLDPVAEAALQTSLRDATRGRTVIEIAHRAPIARGADRIVVIDAGAVVESGTHDALMQARGVYFELFAQAQERA